MRSLLIATIATLLFSWAPAGETTDNYIGYAYSETENLLYTEEFTDRFINGKHLETLTDYFDPSHKKIAQRILDFRKSKYAPDFTTEDLRSGYIEGAEIVGDKIRLFNRRNKNSEINEKVMSIPSPVVVDGGFNQFIKANWSELENGKTITFHFAIPARLDYFTLRAAKVESTETEMKIRVEPDKAVLRWIAEPIIVNYSKDTRRIMSYQGQSNISDEKGNSFVMKLVYPKKGP